MMSLMDQNGDSFVKRTQVRGLVRNLRRGERLLILGAKSTPKGSHVRYMQFYKYNP